MFNLHCKIQNSIGNTIVSPEFYSIKPDLSGSESLAFLQYLDTNNRFKSTGESDVISERNLDILENPEQLYGMTSKWGTFVLSAEDFSQFIELYVNDMEKYNIPGYQQFYNEVSQITSTNDNKDICWI